MFSLLFLGRMAGEELQNFHIPSQQEHRPAALGDLQIKATNTKRILVLKGNTQCNGEL